MMMCMIKEDAVNSLLKKRSVLNGIPKGTTFVEILSPRIRRSHRTMGSTLCRCEQDETGYTPYSSGTLFHKVDGEPVVPDQGSITTDDKSSVNDTGLERGSGNSVEGDSDAHSTSASPEPIPENPKTEDIMSFIKKWKMKEESYKRGYKVPRKLNKLAEIGIKHKNSIFKDLYSILYDPATYDLAYNAIKSKQGNMTLGADGTTLDGWGTDNIEAITQRMRDESFRFSPARTIDIPKPDGSKRKLKIAPPKDKVVQRAIAWILECIYEPTFSPNSFGFRPNKGCHDALKYMQLKFGSARWLIEGDISKCFDEIDHELLITILRRRIKDEKFIRLIRKALKAGYLNQ